MINFRELLLLFIFSLFLPEAVLADSKCIDNTVCIEAVQKNENVDFHIINLKAFDVTVTLTINTVNLKTPDPPPFMKTITGNSRMKVFHLPVLDRTQKWSYTYNIDWTRGSLHARHDNSYIYSLPYEKGTSHKISQGCNGKFSHDDVSRYAVDFLMPEGTAVYASREGTVVGVKDDSDSGGPTESGDLANYVIIRHNDRTIGEYLHLKKDGAAVKTGDKVSRGQLIGYSGNTGFTTEPHLHFGVFKTYNGNRRISFPIKFRSTSGILSCPVKGENYVAE